MSPVAAVHNGAHVLGLPEQLVLPVASDAYNLWPLDVTKRGPLAIAGDDEITSPVAAVHKMAPVAARNAYNLVPDPTYTTPFTTAGAEVMPLLGAVGPTHAGSRLPTLLVLTRVSSGLKPVWVGP